MAIIVEAEFTPFIGLMTDVLKGHTSPLSSSTKVEQARRDGHQLGFTEGVASALAYIGTEERIRLIKPVSDPNCELMVSAVYDYEVKRWLQSVKERWVAGEWKEVSDDAFFDTIWQEFLGQVVYGDKWLDTYRGQRKRAILAGLIKPTPEDADWLREEREKLAEIVSPYDAALAKIK